jgi:hypothetical protein
MKTTLKVVPMLLCFSVVLTSSNFLTQLAAANPADTERVTFTYPIMVAGSKLEPDTYRLVWEGAGPQVQVSFIKGSKTVATASATLVVGESHYDGAIEMKKLDDNTQVLEKITWKKKALVFQPSS